MNWEDSKDKIIDTIKKLEEAKINAETNVSYYAELETNYDLANKAKLRNDDCKEDIEKKIMNCKAILQQIEGIIQLDEEDRELLNTLLKYCIDNEVFQNQPHFMLWCQYKYKEILEGIKSKDGNNLLEDERLSDKDRKNLICELYVLNSIDHLFKKQ